MIPTNFFNGIENLVRQGRRDQLVLPTTDLNKNILLKPRAYAAHFSARDAEIKIIQLIKDST